MKFERAHPNRIPPKQEPLKPEPAKPDPIIDALGKHCAAKPGVPALVSLLASWQKIEAIFPAWRAWDPTSDICPVSPESVLALRDLSALWRTLSVFGERMGYEMLCDAALVDLKTLHRDAKDLEDRMANALRKGDHKFWRLLSDAQRRGGKRQMDATGWAVIAYLRGFREWPKIKTWVKKVLKHDLTARQWSRVKSDLKKAGLLR